MLAAKRLNNRTITGIAQLSYKCVHQDQATAYSARVKSRSGQVDTRMNERLCYMYTMSHF